MRPSVPSLIVLLVLLSVPDAVRAQNESRTSQSITGHVYDAETGEPLPGANVFLDGTRRGTATNAEGYFHIRRIPDGQYDLVASMVGYASLKRPVQVPQASRRSFRFRLSRSTTELEGVTVQSDRSQWLRRLRRFKRLFIGNTRNARKTTLENPEVLGFEVLEEPDPDVFKAKADGPLRVINEALGYEITFHLKRFEAQERGVNHYAVYRGSTRFRELEPESEKQRRRWIANRRRTYEGSFQHFVRVLAAGDFESEGFRVYRSHEITLNRNEASPSFGRRVRDFPEKTRVRAAGAISQPGPREHSLYLYVSTEENPYLRVEYTRQPPEALFNRRYREGGGNRYGHQVSWLESPGPRTLVSTETGSYPPGYSLTKRGYWGWSQRAANLLPRHYPSDAFTKKSGAPVARPRAPAPSSADATEAAAPAETPPEKSALEEREEAARVSATVGECTPHQNGFSCTLDVRRVHALGGHTLPVSLTAFWPNALLETDAQSLPAMLAPGSEVEVALQLSSASVEVNTSSPWTVTRVHASSGAGQSPQ